jgi:hypothetical protein
MTKALLIILVVVAALIGGLFVLRGSTRAGMPDADVLDRAKQRARELADAEKKDSNRDGD